MTIPTEHPAEHHASHEITISAIETIDDAVIDTFYREALFQPLLDTTLTYMQQQMADGVTLPYFADSEPSVWQQKPKSLDIYITDSNEGQALNLEARGKDYATNILSYPSDLPASLIDLMPEVPLGELIICHDVVAREAAEQDKSIAQHLSHLLVHGVLHLLGFDHMLGQAQQAQMESFEIDILAQHDLPNPYITPDS